MKKTTVWEFTDEERRVLKDAMFVYEEVLCDLGPERDWDPDSYAIANSLFLSFGD